MGKRDRSLSAVILVNLGSCDKHLLFCFSHNCVVFLFNRITFSFGLLFQHANLNSLTHEALHEIFGYYSIKWLNQLSNSLKSKKFVSYSGENIYLPDLDKKERLKSPDYLEKIGRLDFPITFLVGEPALLCTPFIVASDANLDKAYNFVVIHFLLFFNHPKRALVSCLRSLGA